MGRKAILGGVVMEDPFGILARLQGTVKLANLGSSDLFLWRIRDARCRFSASLRADLRYSAPN